MKMADLIGYLTSNRKNSKYALLHAHRFKKRIDKRTAAKWLARLDNCLPVTLVDYKEKSTAGSLTFYALTTFIRNK